MKPADPLFDVSGRVAVLTGAGGVLIGALARELGARGTKVVCVSRSKERGDATAGALVAAGCDAHSVVADVMNRDTLEAAAKEIVDRFGRVDILVNGAGGNQPGATTGPDRTFFDLPAEAMRQVLDLNLMGTVLPSQAFGRIMADRKEGIILNISSMNSFRPLTRIVGYSAAKASVNNFTQWLAVHLAQTCSPKIRVNAVAPGFFESEQNRFLLRNADGTLTARGQQIIGHTPMGRFGAPDDLIGAALWLLSPASAFVTGIVVPVDGGFSAFSGI